MSFHIDAPFGSIAPFVIISGDPLRTEQMSRKFLKNSKLVNKTRNMYIYTGYYQNVLVSLASSGIGFSSIAIYVYELYKFYKVQVIIRTGTCGQLNGKNQLLDILNIQKAITTEPFLEDFYPHLSIEADFQLQSYIQQAAQKSKIPLFSNTCALSNKKFYFSNAEQMLARQKIDDLDVVEMEAYILFMYALLFKARAACLLTVTDLVNLDSSCQKYQTIAKISSEDRADSLYSMFVIALETCLIWQKDKMK